MARPKREDQHLVLDNEAACALVSSPQRHRKRDAVTALVFAATGRVVVPTAVRVEVGWRRRDPASAEANRLVTDTALGSTDADRAVELRHAVPSASVVDATVAAAAERLATEHSGKVFILTSDVGDMRPLAGQLDRQVEIKLV